jgi:hypothetical protein
VLVLCTVSRSGRSRRIDAAVMLWTATHLDSGRPRKHRGTQWAAVVRNGSRCGRRSGSPRLDSSCRTCPCPFTLTAPGVSREKPPMPSGCSGARVKSRPRSTYRTVQRRHEQLLIPHRSPPSWPGIIALHQKKNHLSHQTGSSQSGRELLLTAQFGRSLNPTRCGCESRL